MPQSGTDGSYLDVMRQPEAVRRPLSRILQHGLEVVGDHPIERGRLWPAADVARHGEAAAPVMRSNV
jgi:hypothetical protein